MKENRHMGVLRLGAAITALRQGASPVKASSPFNLTGARLEESSLEFVTQRARVRVNFVAAHKGSGVRVQGSCLILNGLRESASENWCY